MASSRQVWVRPFSSASKLKLKLRIPIPETAFLRSQQAAVVFQSNDERHLLLGNTDENGIITADDGTYGILFKITHLQEHEKINLLRNMKANFVGSTVNDLSCFSKGNDSFLTRILIDSKTYEFPNSDWSLIMSHIRLLKYNDEENSGGKTESWTFTLIGSIL